MAEKLSRAQRFVPDLRHCSLDRLQAVIAQLRSAGPAPSQLEPDDHGDSDSASGIASDDSDPPSPPASQSDCALPSLLQLPPIGDGVATNLLAPPLPPVSPPLPHLAVRSPPPAPVLSL